jgi:hypothetical protein
VTRDANASAAADGAQKWDAAARVAFVVGCAPVAAAGFVLSFFSPSVSLAGWLVWGMSFGAWVTLFLGVVAGFVVGAVLAAPFWLTARVKEARVHRGTHQSG